MPASPAGRLSDSRLARRLNTQLCELAASGPDDPLPLFCECGAAGCMAPVWLTPREFRRFLAAGDLVLMPDHEPAPAVRRPPRRAASRGRPRRPTRTIAR